MIQSHGFGSVATTIMSASSRKLAVAQHFTASERLVKVSAVSFEVVHRPVRATVMPQGEQWGQLFEKLVCRAVARSAHLR